ncbi:MAG: hypothetical protein LBJ19_00155 [Holosporaceae bacterium]|nr:hypothetical protein [Holosporaceae bacterium]
MSLSRDDGFTQHIIRATSCPESSFGRAKGFSGRGGVSSLFSSEERENESSIQIFSLPTFVNASGF